MVISCARRCNIRAGTPHTALSLTRSAGTSCLVQQRGARDLLVSDASLVWHKTADDIVDSLKKYLTNL
jgi:hypothetical protein